VAYLQGISRAVDVFCEQIDSAFYELLQSIFVSACLSLPTFFYGFTGTIRQIENSSCKFSGVISVAFFYSNLSLDRNRK